MRRPLPATGEEHKIARIKPFFDSDRTQQVGHLAVKNPPNTPRSLDDADLKGFGDLPGDHLASGLRVKFHRAAGEPFF